jgi:HK97 family phage major capsid protein
MNINQTGGFSSPGEFFVAVRKYEDNEHRDSRIDVLRKAALTEGTDSGGGYLVPPEFAKQIYNAALEGSIVRSRAQIQPMTRDTLEVPILVDSDRSSSMFGGVTLTWQGEGADQYSTTVKPVFGKLTLTAKKAIASCFIANELEDDAAALERTLLSAFGSALRFYEDDAFIHGSGVNQPLGIMHCPAMLSIARSTGFSAPLADDFANMTARLLPGSFKSAVWLLNQSFLGSLSNEATTGANAYRAINLSEMKAFGMPMIVTEHCAAAGTIGELILADFSQYVIGDRALYVSASRHATYSSNTYGFLQDQTLWKITLRVDGQPALPAAITPLRGGSTLSSFVTLTTAS